MLTRKNSWDLGRRSLDMVSMRSIKIRTKEEGEIAGGGEESIPAQFTSADGEGKDLYACHNNDAVFARLLSNLRLASSCLEKMLVHT